MSIHKSQNPVFVIATLGVYFGLILAGATPQVLANAAMTRTFDVMDEVEVNDNLDKNPNGFDVDDVPNNDLFVTAVIELANDLSRLEGQRKFSWDKPLSVTVEDLSFCESDNSPSYSGTSREVSPAAQAAFEKRAIQVGRAYFEARLSLGIGKKYESWPNGVSFDLKTDQTGLSLDIKFVTKDVDAASLFGKEVNKRFLQSRLGLSVEQKTVLETTKSKVTDNTVILLIRLPRAGLTPHLR